jgi:abequosyltransferase
VQPKITFAIPTYNRADQLRQCVESLTSITDQINPDLFSIHIFDNASLDGTYETVQDIKKLCATKILYSRKDKHSGPDENFEFALKEACGEYIWLFGDSYSIPQASIEAALKAIKCTPDFVALNFQNKCTEPSMTFHQENCQEALKAISGTASSLSTLIYKKEIVVNLNFEKYANSNFLQTGIVFEYLVTPGSTLIWNREHSVHKAKTNLLDTHWSHTIRALEWGCKKWVLFIESLPSHYTIESKGIALKRFGQDSGLLKYSGIAAMRLRGILNVKTFHEYSYYLEKSSAVPMTFIYVICRLPRVFAVLFLAPKLLGKISQKLK